MGEKVKGQEDEIMVENESDLMDRLEILGDLTDNLDKKQIDGGELDKVVRSLFDKYQAEQSPKVDSDSFFTRPCVKCEEKIHLRLYHPTNKCVNFKRSENGQ